MRPIVPVPDDYSIMVLESAPPADLWDVDEVVDVSVGNEVWAISRLLVEEGLWGVSFVTNPGKISNDGVNQDPAFWEALVMEDLAADLGNI